MLRYIVAMPVVFAVSGEFSIVFLAIYADVHLKLCNFNEIKFSPN